MKVGKVRLAGRTLWFGHQQYDVAGASASVETDGEIAARFTATRLALMGPFALAFKKKKDHRGLFLMVDGPAFAFVAELDPKHDMASSRKMAQAINSAGRRYQPAPIDGSSTAWPAAQAGAVQDKPARRRQLPEPGPVESYEGYMVVASFDGRTLRAHGTNKVSQLALVGPGRDELALDIDEIESVHLNAANAMTNGRLTIARFQHADHVLHFRRKANNQFESLHGRLREALAQLALQPALSDDGPALPDASLDEAPADAATAPAAPPPAPLAIPAGWYPNATGPGQRYWDGSGWTDHTAP